MKYWPYSAGLLVICLFPASRAASAEDIADQIIREQKEAAQQRARTGQQSQLLEELRGIRGAIDRDPLERASQRRASAFDLEIALTNALDEAERRKEQRAADAERQAKILKEASERVAEESARWEEHRQRGALLSAERPGSGGTITGRGKTIAVPARANRGAAPMGMVWIFPERSAQPSALAPIETAEMTEEQGKAAAQASHKRTVEKYPFLANKADPRRVQFDGFLKQAWDSAHYETMFSLRDWREYAADECALIFGWGKTGSSPAAGDKGKE